MNDTILDLDFRASRGFEENPSRKGANMERAMMSVLPVFAAPAPGMIWGVDVSHWDGNVNFEPTAAAGAKFAFIKCVDGTMPTPYFRENLARAHAAGLLASGYGWLYPDSVVSAALQARRMAELHDLVEMTMPAVIDFEWTRYAGEWRNPGFSDLLKWAREYNRLTGRKAILYSAAGYMNDFGTMPDELKELFFGFWWASYSTAPLYPRGFNYYDCWQFSANGDALKLAPGDKNKLELDLNYMTPAFYARIGGTVQEQPEPAPGGSTMAKYKVVWAGGVARRTAPHTGTSTQATYTGLTYPEGAVVEVVQENIPDGVQPTNTNRVWVKFAEKMADGRDLYGAAEYPDSLGAPSVRMVKVEEAPTAPAPKEVVKAVLYAADGSIVKTLQ